MPSDQTEKRVPVKVRELDLLEFAQVRHCTPRGSRITRCRESLIYFGSC